MNLRRAACAPASWCLFVVCLLVGWETILGAQPGYAHARDADSAVQGGLDGLPFADRLLPAADLIREEDGPARLEDGPARKIVVARAQEAEPEGLGVDLPATYGGDLPCADCDAIRYRLNLWPDHVFNLRRRWLPAGRSQDTLGRWWIDPALGRLILWDGEGRLEFSVLPGRLRPVDASADGPARPRDLTGASGTTALGIRVPVRGMVSFLADRALITECVTGRVYPLSTSREFPTLEAAYLAAGVAQGTPLMSSFEGRVLETEEEEDGETGPTIVVNRFTGVWPKETCEQAMSSRSLTDTYWRVVRLGKTEVAAIEGNPDPHLILTEDGGRFEATVGCNALVGTFERDGDNLNFRNPAAAIKACAAPLDEWERMLTGALAAARGWRVNGEALELLDSSGMQIGLFRASEATR